MISAWQSFPGSGCWVRLPISGFPSGHLDQDAIWLYSYSLDEWLYTTESNFPAIYGYGSGEVNGWYYYFHIEGVGTYLYDYVTRSWISLSM